MVQFSVDKYNNVIMTLISVPVEINLSELFSALFETVAIRLILFLVLLTVLSIVNMLVIIYFSMAISRVTFRNKRVGGLWFILFLVLSGLIIYGGVKISELLPYYIDINTLKIGTMDTLNLLYMEIGDGVVLSANTDILTTNIASTVYMIIVTVLLFLGTGYLVERKIDL